MDFGIVGVAVIVYYKGAATRALYRGEQTVVARFWQAFGPFTALASASRTSTLMVLPLLRLNARVCPHPRIVERVCSSLVGCHRLMLLNPASAQRNAVARLAQYLYLIGGALSPSEPSSPST